MLALGRLRVPVSALALGRSKTPAYLYHPSYYAHLVPAPPSRHLLRRCKMNPMGVVCSLCVRVGCVHPSTCPSVCLSVNPCTCVWHFWEASWHLRHQQVCTQVWTLCSCAPASTCCCLLSWLYSVGQVAELEVTGQLPPLAFYPLEGHLICYWQLQHWLLVAAWKFSYPSPSP